MNGPEGFFGSQRVIQDRILSITPHNGIMSQFKTSSAADGMIISLLYPLGSIKDIIIPLLVLLCLEA